MPTKVCSACKQELPKTSEYFSHHIKPSGTLVFDFCCKPCAAAKKREKRRINPEHEREIDRLRHERDHGKRLQQARDSHRRHKDKRNAKMKENWKTKGEQYKANSRSRYAINPEIGREQCKQWRKAHPVQAKISDRNKRAKRRKAEGTHTLRDERNQREKQRNRCYWCSEILDDKFQVDHIQPLARGGTNWASNIVISCPSCNNSKNAKLPYIEWQPRNPLFPPE